MSQQIRIGNSEINIPQSGAQGLASGAFYHPIAIKSRLSFCNHFQERLISAHVFCIWKNLAGRWNVPHNKDRRTNLCTKYASPKASNTVPHARTSVDRTDRRSKLTADQMKIPATSKKVAIAATIGITLRMFTGAEGRNSLMSADFITIENFRGEVRLYGINRKNDCFVRSQ
jgi:hypothetical protein